LGGPTKAKKNQPSKTEVPWKIWKGPGICPKKVKKGKGGQVRGGSSKTTWGRENSTHKKKEKKERGCRYI